MASQSASQSDVDDQRFAELLKPIKDLTQNWQVPLADLLSTYIDDLQHVTITFDGGETSVNFAEAALLLQGTASVYSKKVEFLWQMVMQTLDMLRSKKGEEGEGGGEEGATQTQKGRKKNQLDMTREFELLVADLGKNIDVKNEEESLEDRKNALNFIYITPRQLIEKEGSEQKAVKVNLFMGVLAGKWDLLAGKEDFRINSQYVSVTGGLGEDLTVDNQYLSVSLDQEDSILAPESPEQPTPFSPLHDSNHPPSPLPDQDMSNMSYCSTVAAAQHLSTPPPPECLASLPSPCPSPCPSPAPVDTTPEPVFDPWAPLDPYEILSTPKPLKRGKTIRLPPSLSSKQKRAKPLPPIEQYLVQEMTASLYNPSMLPNVAPVFYDLAAMELLRRREREKEERMKRLIKAPGVRREVFHDPLSEEAGQQDLFDNFDNDEGVPDDPINDGPDNFPDDDDDFPNPHIGGDVGSLVVEDLSGNDVGEAAGDSYEELVARRVAEFVQQSQEFLKSSELTRRVSKWHEMIGPRLDKVERRKAFDVHLYGSRVLSKFPDPDTTPGNSKEKFVKFNSVVRGERGEEVARFFLSTLMLANTMNVEISTEPGTDPQHGMDNVQLSLLSNMRHHEQLAEFQAASQAETAEMNAEVVDNVLASSQPGPAGPSKPKKAKKTAPKEPEESEEMFDESDEEEFRKPDIPAKKKGKKKK